MQGEEGVFSRSCTWGGFTPCQSSHGYTTSIVYTTLLEQLCSTCKEKTNRIAIIVDLEITQRKNKQDCNYCRPGDNVKVLASLRVIDKHTSPQNRSLDPTALRLDIAEEARRGGSLMARRA